MAGVGGTTPCSIKLFGKHFDGVACCGIRNPEFSRPSVLCRRLSNPARGGHPAYHQLPLLCTSLASFSVSFSRPHPTYFAAYSPLSHSLSSLSTPPHITAWCPYSCRCRMPLLPAHDCGVAARKCAQTSPPRRLCTQSEGNEDTVEKRLFHALTTTKLVENITTGDNYSRCGRTDRGVSALGNVRRAIPFSGSLILTSRR